MAVRGLLAALTLFTLLCGAPGALVLPQERVISSAEAVSAVDAPPLPLEVFTLSQLKALHDPATLRRLRHAVFNTGMLAVGPNMDSLSSPSPTSTALEALVRCASAHGLDGMTNAVTLADGSTRTTLATSTHDSVPQPLPSDLQSRCPALLPPASEVRRLAAETGLAYAAALDTLVHGPGLSPLQLQLQGLDSFTQAVMQGESLEHFHLFTRPRGGRTTATAPAAVAASNSQATAALHMHTDIGLFIVMTAAQYFETAEGADNDEESKLAGEAGESDAAPAPGLYLELPSGRVVRPQFPEGSMLVMTGEAASRWMHAREGAPLPPAAPHEVVLPANMGGRVRAWYGRMFFPLPDAKLQDIDNAPLGADATSQPEALTFGRYRSETMSLLQSGQQHMTSALGCGTTRRLLQDQGACPAGQIYCWMQCMDIPSDLTCSKDTLQCKNPAGQLWPQDFPNGDASHCFDCQPVCPNQEINTTESTGDFCNTQLTPITMWMTGFQFATSPSNPCVALLFREWPLDSRVKFGFACVGTFLMGMATAALGHIRSQLLSSRTGGPPKGSEDGGADEGDADGMDVLESGRRRGVEGLSAQKVGSAAAADRLRQSSGCPCPASWGKPIEGAGTQVQGSPLLATGAPVGSPEVASAAGVPGAASPVSATHTSNLSFVPLDLVSVAEAAGDAHLAHPAAKVNTITDYAEVAAPKAAALPAQAAAAAPNGLGHGLRQFLHRPGVWKAVHLVGETLLFAVQMTLAYFLMLIAMTYEAELFIAVVLGLAAGHGALLYYQGEQGGQDKQGVLGRLYTGSLSSKDGQEAAAGNRDRVHGHQAGMANPEPCCSFA